MPIEFCILEGHLAFSVVPRNIPIMITLICSFEIPQFDYSSDFATVLSDLFQSTIAHSPDNCLPFLLTQNVTYCYKLVFLNNYLLHVIEWDLV